MFLDISRLDCLN